MQRSVGVTVSAVFVFLGSGLVLLFGGFAGFAAMFVPQRSEQAPFLRYILVGSVVMYFAFAMWGIASGVGLLLLRKWARISILVFSGILLLFSVPTLVVLPFLPMQTPANSGGEFVSIVKFGMATFYFFLALVGGGWIYFFTRRRVKEEFYGPEALAALEANPPKRPLSITVIGWLLLVSGCLVLPFVMLLHYPTMCMGFVLRGWSSVLFMSTWCVVQAVAGVGLLKLRPWARSLTIGSFSFGILNCASILLLPGSMGRFLQMNAEMQATMHEDLGLPGAAVSPMSSPETAHVFLLMGLIAGVAATLLQLWFVVTRKEAFSEAPDVPALMP